MKTFKVADMVRLKTGGSAMLIRGEVSDSGETLVRCQWQDDNGEPHDECYPEEFLKPVEDPARIEE